MAGQALTGQSLRPGRNFDWIFLIELLVSGILTIFFLFYFNRVFGTLVSYALRVYTWRKYRVYIDIEAIQVSLLGGRIFFKGVRYHGDNETVLIHDGHITWQYWLRRVREVDYNNSRRKVSLQASGEDVPSKQDGSHRHASGGEKGESKGSDALPCRVILKTRGIEWFIYNRSSAYDAVLSGISKKHGLDGTKNHSPPLENDSLKLGKSEQRNRFDGSNSTEKLKPRSPLSADEEFSDIVDIKTTSSGHHSIPAGSINDKNARNHDDDSFPKILETLPIQIECITGAIVLGNDNTRSILVAKFEKAVGHIDASSAGPIDQYKQIINFGFTHPTIQIKPNHEFKETQLATGAKLYDSGEEKSRSKFHKEHQWSYQRQRRRFWHSVRDLIPYFQKSVDSFGAALSRSGRDTIALSPIKGVPGQDRWLGLTRYLDEEDEGIEQERWKAIEYGKFSSVVDCPFIGMNYHWDIPGKVHQSKQNNWTSAIRDDGDVNGDIPPEWGLDLQIRGGFIHYGPWADRQRVDLQTVFFPSSYQDAVPADVLHPGERRVSTVFKIVVEIEDDTIVRIPTREDSKDWKWKGRHGTGTNPDTKRKGKKKSIKSKKTAKSVASPDVRPFGWLDLKVLRDSTVSCTMDMVARNAGFHNKIELDLRGPEMSSSVNHGLLWRSNSQTVSCDLSFPLGWNAPRQWNFDIHSDGLDLFLLRDHMFLITDLVNDWASGPPGDFYTFIPFSYAINLRFAQFKLYLNGNDSNIINDPSNIDGNHFLVIWGKELAVSVGIPLDIYRPSRNRVSFDVDARDGGFNVRVPQWNTQHAFLDSNRVALMKDLRLDGSYDYFTSTSPSLTDSVTLNIHGATPTVFLHGFLIRLLMNLKDNYFGENVHFHTLDEYQVLLSRPKDIEVGTAVEAQHIKLTNDLDVILTITTTEGSVMLPSNLYSSIENIKLDIPSVEADLRFTNYYMDLNVTVSPVSLSLNNSNLSLEENGIETQTQLFVDGIHVYGHRLFGLPPTEPTYICNWDFEVGSVSGECSTEFLAKLRRSLRCFPFSFDEKENALPPMKPPVVHDMTILRATILPIRVWVHVDEAAFLLSTDVSKLNFNDWAGRLFSERLHLLIPNLTLACVDGQAAARERNITAASTDTYAYIKTTVDLRMLERKLTFLNERKLQQDHIRTHDQRTRRTDFLLHDSDHLIAPGAQYPGSKIKPPAMTFPPLPAPIVNFNSLGSKATSNISPSDYSSSGKRTINRKTSSSASFGLRHKSPLNLPETGNAQHQRAESRSDTSPNVSANQRQSFVDTESESIENSPPFLSGPSNFQNAKSRRGQYLPVPTSTFSSPYAVPHFPLLSVNPNQSEVPSIPPDALHERVNTQGTDLYDGWLADSVIDDRPHTSFMLRLSSGLTSYCTPIALDYVVNFFSEMQPKQPESLLDGLQMDVMEEVFSMASMAKNLAKTTELSVQVPYTHIKLLNSHYDGVPSTLHRDYYDLMIRRLALTGRILTRVESGQEPRPHHQFTGHVSLDRLETSAKEHVAGSTHDEAAIRGDLDDLDAWVSFDDTRSGSLQFRHIKVASTSRKIEYLASLLYRTTALVNAFICGLTSTKDLQRRRLGYLVYSLTTNAGDIPDPPCLTQATNFLRSVNDHGRNNESWKIISRLRFIYHNIPDIMRQEIVSRCGERFISCPDDLQNLVIASFDQWRSWDLANVGDSLIMLKVYGSFTDTPRGEDSKPIPFSASLNGGHILLLLNPGPKQSEILIERLIIGITLNQPLIPESSLSTQDVRKAKSSIMQIDCFSIAFRLNWEICELIEDTFCLFNSSQDTSSRGPDHLSTTSSSAETENKLQIVVVSETSTLSFDTIHLRMVSLARGLKSSLVVSKMGLGHLVSVTSLAVSSDAATSEVLDHYKVLGIFRLRRPSVFFSVSSQDETQCIRRTWKAAASAQHLFLDIQEDLLGVLETLDLVLRDEIAYLFMLIKSLRSHAPNGTSPTPFTRKQIVHKVRAALFLDGYNVDLILLRSLAYAVSGKGSRISVNPNPRGGSGLVVDFDINKHIHEFKAKTERTLHEIASLLMPPINGNIIAALGNAEQSITFNTAIESIDIDAAALYGLLTTVNRPEIANLFQRVRKDVSLMKLHAQKIFDIQQTKPVLTPSSPVQAFIYDAHLTVVGLAIHATAPVLRQEAASAKLLLELGLIHLSATNKAVDSVSTSGLTAFDVKMPQTKLTMFQISHQEAIPCGDFRFSLALSGTTREKAFGDPIQAYQIRSDVFEVNLYAETAAMTVDLLGFLQERMKTLDLSNEVKNLRRLRRSRAQLEVSTTETDAASSHSTNDAASSILFSSMCSFELTNIQVSWNVGKSTPIHSVSHVEDLVLSFKRILLTTQRENAARLVVEDFQLQMVPTLEDKRVRSLNSALLPEVVFNVAYLSSGTDRRLAFQAAGKSLDLHLTSHFILPASSLQHSIALASGNLRAATATWNAMPSQDGSRRKDIFGDKRFTSLLVDADFAGAVVYIRGKKTVEPQTKAMSVLQGSRLPQHGRYGQFTGEDASSNTTLRAPGLAFKIQYKDAGIDDPSLNIEIKVDASSNILYPTVVPLVLEISSSIKEVMGKSDGARQSLEAKPPPPKFFDEGALRTADPNAILGKCRLNLGLRVCRQEFSLSCQPIAKVAATARFADIYYTINTVQSVEQGRFFAISAAFTHLQASLQHVYSREQTGNFDVQSIFISLMNSKHVSAANGVSAIIKVSPIKSQINAKQLDDFLLFREIWLPAGIRGLASAQAHTPPSEAQGFNVQRYKQVASAGAFPWTATVSITELDVQLDFGQALGKSAFMVSNLWVSSKKSSDWEQNLCLGFDRVGIDSNGRMSGFIELQNLHVRTSIQWPQREQARNQTPLVQASLGFTRLQIKASFDYQAFLVADVTSFEFLMYNVREAQEASGDRLVGFLDGGQVQVFCTTNSASQGLALFQAFERLIQEKQTAYETSLKDIEKFLRRKSTANPLTIRAVTKGNDMHSSNGTVAYTPAQLHTDVVVILKALRFGVFPSNFFDTQIFKVEALDASARFAVVLEKGKVHSGLGLTLGQLRIALAAVSQSNVPQTLNEVSVKEVVKSATGSKGGIILNVPKVVATMQTWQIPESMQIDYIFKSSFEGKVDVGWNYSRISFIRGMWTTHTRTLAHRLGKPLPQSAVQIKGGPQPEEGDVTNGDHKDLEKGKITAVVNVPQSKYHYTALEPAVIETPQLRDMGEATPPLEWIGLHRERLPNLTHQIVIVALLEVAKEVEDAYSRILGSS